MTNGTKRRDMRAGWAAVVVFPLLLAGVDAQVYCETFDGGNGGWSALGLQNTWQFGTPAGTAITEAATGNSAWVTSLAGSYQNLEQSFVESPVIDLTGLVVDPILSFAQNFTLASFDETWVEVSLDGGPFVKLGTSNTMGGVNWYNDGANDWWDGSSDGWRVASHPLTGGAGSMVRLRFVLSADEFATDEGVAFDDVEVRDVMAAADVGVVAITAPVTAPALGQEAVTITIENFGTQTQAGFDVTYSVDGGPLVTESIGTAIAPGATADHTFAMLADLSSSGSTFTIEACTALVGDANPCGDCFSTEVTHVTTIVAWPWTEDFEVGTGDMAASGAWEVGTPNGPFINGAASGNRAWVTNLAGAPDVDSISVLTSPIFDFTAVEGDFDPILEFAHSYQLAAGDQGYVEMSLDGEPFVRLGTAGAGTNWYDDIPNQTWAGTSGSAGHWHLASHPMEGAAGRVAQLRFVVEAGEFFAGDGMGIDAIRIECPIPLYPGTGEDLALRTAVGFSVPTGGAGEDRKTVADNNLVTLVVDSPDGTFWGNSYVFAVSTFDFTGGGAIPPVLFSTTPGCPCPGAFANSGTILYTPPPFLGSQPVLQPGGSATAFAWPVGLTADLLIQGFVITNQGQFNTFFVSTNGHVIEEL